MTRLIPLAFLTLSIAACSPADIIEGKPSAFEQYQERLALVAMPAPVQPVVAVSEPLTVAVVEVEPEPECHGDVFRISRCVDGELREW